MGECSKLQSFAILDAFYRFGGNFLDTSVEPRLRVEISQVDCLYRANNYQNEESEI